MIISFYPQQVRFAITVEQVATSCKKKKMRSLCSLLLLVVLASVTALAAEDWKDYITAEGQSHLLC